MSVKEIEQEGYVALATSGKPAGGWGDLVGDTSSPGDSSDGMAGLAELLHTGGRDPWGRRWCALETVFECIK